MKVIEIFKSINGEGLKSGLLSVFVRFEGCNLRCPYCDTKYSYINPKYSVMSIDEIISYIDKANVLNVTLTGGEPLLQDGIYDLVKKISSKGYKVEIETNGSVDIKEYKKLDNVFITLDYKTPSSLMEKFMNLDNYKYIDKNDVVKFCCGTSNDLEKSKEIIKKYKLEEYTNPFISPIYGEINLEEIVEFLKDNDLVNTRLQLQIHKIIWDKDKRGV